ncbi:MAG TPA: AAA family ATPase, partial [Bacteroidales bacterium]|nr:AAA family ATPase [Bacteroidales bacterium]
MIPRKLQSILEKVLFSNKAIIILGARQVGKTTLLKNVIINKQDIIWLNADEIAVRTMFENASSERFKTLFGNAKIII